MCGQRDGSVGKSACACCSSQGSEFVFHHPCPAAHNFNVLSFSLLPLFSELNFCVLSIGSVLQGNCQVWNSLLFLRCFFPTLLKWSMWWELHRPFKERLERHEGRGQGSMPMTCWVWLHRRLTRGWMPQLISEFLKMNAKYKMSLLPEHPGVILPLVCHPYYFIITFWPLLTLTVVCLKKKRFENITIMQLPRNRA